MNLHQNLRDDDKDAETTVLKYRAPALEKGLDVLELLAAHKRPLTLSQISAHLDRSVSELFRMVQVLENRGYVAPAMRGDGLELTNKLFSLGMSRGPSQNLLASAMPVMQGLSESTRQSCHIAIASDNQIVVIARVEAPGDLGFSVRVGHQAPVVKSTSGITLFSFQPHKMKEAWRAQLMAETPPETWRTFDELCQFAQKNNYVQRRSDFTDGITDISCPIFSDGTVIAALTIPYIRSLGSESLEDATRKLQTAVQTISKSLGGVDTVERIPIR
jgi:DNA-binding IclR family transcriptional regulator